MTRLKAASAHFLLSLILFLAVITIVIFLWYPEPHFKVSGGWQGLKIVAMIDLVLGPLLTSIIFNTQKSKAKLMGDLSIIAILGFSLWCYYNFSATSRGCNFLGKQFLFYSCVDVQ